MVSPGPSLLQAEPELSQPVLTGEVSQPSGFSSGLTPTGLHPPCAGGPKDGVSTSGEGEWRGENLLPKTPSTRACT